MLIGRNKIMKRVITVYACFQGIMQEIILGIFQNYGIKFVYLH